MNRRSAIAAAAASIIPLSVSGDAATLSDALRHFIETVIIDGDVSGIHEMVAEMATVPALGVIGIDGFRDASVEGHAARADRYETQKWEIVSIAEQGDFAHALARFEGKPNTGRMEASDVFYVARFVDGLIVELRLG